jgi:hypothetical protein
LENGRTEEYRKLFSPQIFNKKGVFDFMGDEVSTRRYIK